MNSKTNILVIAGCMASCDKLKQELVGTSLATVAGCFTHADFSDGDNNREAFFSGTPTLVLVDVDVMPAAVRTLRWIKHRFPKSWLIVTAESTQPELVIEVMRAGAREFLKRPLQADAIRAALERFHGEEHNGPGVTKRGTFYSVTTAKEGSGATTIALNLAVAMAVSNPQEKVALIDLVYPVGDVAAYLDLKHRFSIRDAIESANRIDSVLLESYVVERERVSVLPGFQKYDPSLPLPLNDLKKVLQVAGETFDRIVVDVPSSHHPEDFRMVGKMSSTVLVVATPELPSLWRTHQLLEFLNRNGTRSSLRVVLNRLHKGCQIGQKQIEHSLSLPVSWSFPNSYRDAIEAINTGRSIVSIGRSKLKRDFLSVARELTDGKREPKRSMFAFLKS